MNEKVLEIYSELDDLEMIEACGQALCELKSRRVIKTKNTIGDIGEWFVMQFYNEDVKLANLQEMPIGTKYFDARSEDGKRYTIKTTTTKATGVFHGLNEPSCELPEEQRFEYVVIVVLHPDCFLPQEVYEINWDDFLAHRKWSNSKKAWNLSLTRRLKEDAKLRFSVNTQIV
ncbi:hypothetical protein ABWK50_11795 [Priestia megaterium]|uniref:hypothetical protein n=1 Tax=Priestia megaterium TaxID=1404 RepID=UPI00339819E4